MRVIAFLIGVVFLAACVLSTSQTKKDLAMEETRNFATVMQIVEGGQVSFQNIRIAASEITGKTGVLWLFHKDSPHERMGVVVSNGDAVQDGDYCVSTLDISAAESGQSFIQIGISLAPCSSSNVVVKHNPTHPISDVSHYPDAESIVLPYGDEQKIGNVSMSVGLAYVFGEQQKTTFLQMRFESGTHNVAFARLPEGSQIQVSDICIVLAKIDQGEDGHPTSTFYKMSGTCESPAVVLTKSFLSPGEGENRSGR